MLTRHEPALTLLLLALAGCAETPTPDVPRTAASMPAEDAGNGSAPPATASPAPGPTSSRDPRRTWGVGSQSGTGTDAGSAGRGRRVPRQTGFDSPDARPVDDERLVAGGLRKMTSRHLTLFTDLPPDPAVAELPEVFDAAVPQWCDFFSVPRGRLADWHMTAYLIRDKQKFRALGVLRADLPPFLHGYQQGPEIWCYEQPSEYYRRHLLLHEGTHGFMHRFLGGAGPPWYMEGTAELLATHRWEGNTLTLNVVPRNRDESAYWGRIKAIRDETAAGRFKSLSQIMGYDTRAHLRVEPYAWCWAAALFFERHPLTSDRFAALRLRVSQRSHDFSSRFAEELSADWPFLVHQWKMFVAELDYGYDASREYFGRGPSRALEPRGIEFELAVDRGWQSSGVFVSAGQTYRIRADGRYQIGTEPDIWWCEPNGVTLRYARGFPLGKLLATVIDEDRRPADRTPLTDPVAIGKARDFVAPRDGTLYFRINDVPGELADNQGSVQVAVRGGEPISN